MDLIKSLKLQKKILKIIYQKIIGFKEIEKIGNQANKKIADSINFKPLSVPIMNFGTTEEKIFFKNLLEYKRAV